MQRVLGHVRDILFIVTIMSLIRFSHEMSKEEKLELREEAREMFYHGYRAYMDNAYPADELMPLSCKGRSRGTKPSRGDMDDILGNFSLTLVDSFDTLVILGDIEGFESATRKIINDVTFDRDIVVSVFETNIRMLGGLISGHVLATYLKGSKKGLRWYDDELLEMAKELGYRLLPAFNTTTGIPFPKVNLRHGVRPDMARTGHEKDTCTACAGTMLLEFAALSRLSGEPIFEAKAHRAMDSLWQYRHRSSNLVGTVINIHNGEWVRRDSGIGAGIDSYYEYLLKAYILLGDDTYLDRFNKHYDSIMRYINQGPLMVDVHMHKPHANARNFMDALFAFWPGLQVLKGDIKPAIEIHEMLYQVIQRHNFLPEAFTTDFRVHWAQHPLRPEFIESTYFLYRATKDPHYLEVGKEVMHNLKRHAMVDCGFAAIKDVTTGRKEDQMDSFVLSETFKYLYLLFSEEEDLILNVDDFVFTTEAHLLPLSLSLHVNDRNISTDGSAIFYQNEEAEDSHDVTCPNLAHNDVNYGQRLRHPLRNLVESVCPKSGSKNGGSKQRRLKATEFTAGNMQQISELKTMGIKIVTMSDGRVQLLHTASDAASPNDAQDGMLFMQEMIELSKTQASDQIADPHIVQLLSDPFYGRNVYPAGPAQFGYDLKVQPGVQGQVAIADPFVGCGSILNPELLAGKVAIARRGDCMFIDKARLLESVGVKALIVIDNIDTSSAMTSPMFAMSGDNVDDVNIPVVFLFWKEGKKLMEAFQEHPDLVVYIAHTDKTLDLVLKETLEKDKIINRSVYTKMGVAIRRFDGLDEQKLDPVMHTFYSSEDRPIYRIVQRRKDNKLEIQLETEALKSATKRQLSTLIEKVASLVQADINFGDLDLIEQSDHLFALGKLMEATVHEESVEDLESCMKTIMEDDLHLSYDDVMDAVNEGKVGEVQPNQSKLEDFVDMLVDDYIKGQFDMVYDKAKNFLQQLGLSIPEKAYYNTVIGFSDMDYENKPQATQNNLYMEKRESESCGKSQQSESDEAAIHCEQHGDSVACESEDKIWILPKSGTIEIDENVNSLKSETETKHFVNEDDINESIHHKVKIQKVKDANIKDTTRVYKPPDWMSLADDEIFFDANGIIYANYAEDYYYGEDSELKDDNTELIYRNWLKEGENSRTTKKTESTKQELNDLQNVLDDISLDCATGNIRSQICENLKSILYEDILHSQDMDSLETTTTFSDETEILDDNSLKNLENKLTLKSELKNDFETVSQNHLKSDSNNRNSEQITHLDTSKLPQTDEASETDIGVDNSQNNRHQNADKNIYNLETGSNENIDEL